MRWRRIVLEENDLAPNRVWRRVSSGGFASNDHKVRRSERSPTTLWRTEFIGREARRRRTWLRFALQFRAITLRCCDLLDHEAIGEVRGIATSLMRVSRRETVLHPDKRPIVADVLFNAAEHYSRFSCGPCSASHRMRPARAARDGCCGSTPRRDQVRIPAGPERPVRPGAGEKRR